MSPASRLEELVASVREEAAGDGPIAQLAKASEYADGLNKTGELLLDHFVRECRKAEASMAAQLSAALKMSDLAAHKRFTADDQVQDQVVEHASRVEDAVSSGGIPFSRRSKSLLKAVLDEASGLGHLWSVAGISGRFQPGRPLM